MKHIILLPLCSLIAAGPISAAGQADTKTTPPAATDPAEEAKPESELRSTGIAFSVEEESLLITPENVKIPLTFVRATDTPLVDENGKAVSWEQIRTGIPLTVEYSAQGDKMVASKVVVTRYMVEGGKEVAATDEDGKKRAELALIKHLKAMETADKAKTQPTTSGGTIMGFEQVIAISDGNGGEVTQYVVNNSTQYITSGGKPVAPGLVRTGVRVDVKFVENSGRKIATQMILYGVPAQGAALNSGGGTSGSTTQSNGTATNGTAASNNGTATNSGGGGSNTTAWVDQFGNIIPGTLETGFINPPVTVLPNMRNGNNTSATTGTNNGANTGTAANNGTNPNAANNGANTGTNTGTGTVNGNTNNSTTPPQQQPGQPNTTQPATTQPNTTQPNTTQPNTTQPNTTQPKTTQPGTRQPSTRQPATRPATSSPSSGAPASPAPAPSTGR